MGDHLIFLEMGRGLFFLQAVFFHLPEKQLESQNNFFADKMKVFL